MNIPQEQNFYVIKFLQLPHASVPQVVCVPNSWVRTRSPSDDTVCVSYPVEQHIATEGRILTGEPYKQEWKLFMAKWQGGFDSYDEARVFIASLQNSTQQQEEEDIEENYIDDEDDDEYEPVPSKINRRRVSFSSPRKTINITSLMNESMRSLAGSTSSEKAFKFQHMQQRGSFTNCKPGFFEPRAGHPPKRRLSSTQPSTSAQAMADSPTLAETNNKKIRLKRDLKNISRAFVNIDDQFDDLNNVLNRIRASMTDMQSVFSSLCSNLNDIMDLGDIMQHSSDNNERTSPSTFIPGILKSSTSTRTKTEIPHVPSTLRNLQDSKWTLRYRDKVPGVVELMPNSGIYLAEIGLKGAMKSATDSKTLARMLMKEIFSDYALSVCSLAGGKNGMSDRVRPGLDKTARAFLMEFVTQYSRDKGWEVSEHSVLMSLRNKLLEMRRTALNNPVVL